MSTLFQTYYNGIPIGMVIGFTSYFLGYAVGGFLHFTKVGMD